MPTATVPAFVLDQFGRQAVYNHAGTGSAGVLYKRTKEDNNLRPIPPNHFADYIKLFSPQRYAELVSECRSIASRGLVSAILEQKSDYVAASGFRPRFSGSDTAWGIVASAALEDALKICSLRGGRFDWRSLWRLAVPTRATDGRFFVLLTEWDSGWPATQFLEGHRIGQRNNYANRIDDSDKTNTLYRGLNINNGVITNAVGTEVAYRVLGATPEEDQDISARDMIHVASPQRYSEGVTPPDLARALLDFLALDTAQTCQLDQQIADAKITVVETNATGKVDQMAALTGMAAASPEGAPTEVIERGSWRVVKSGTGSLTPWESDRPSDQWMNFDQRVASRAAAAVRWRIEMLDPTALRGAATRAFQDQINTSIQDEFLTIAPAAVRVVGYFISKLIGLGVIPNSDEWMRWTIAPPPWFEVDRASARIDIEDVAAGRVPMSTLHSRDGMTTSEVYTARASAYEQALDIQAKHPNVPLEYILGTLGVQTAPVQTEPAQPAAAPEPEKKPASKAEQIIIQPQASAPQNLSLTVNIAGQEKASKRSLSVKRDERGEIKLIEEQAQ